MEMELLMYIHLFFAWLVHKCESQKLFNVTEHKKLFFICKQNLERVVVYDYSYGYPNFQCNSSITQRLASKNIFLTYACKGGLKCFQIS